jgi:16S rRNA (cytosine1402-N4)-methyltransferase
VSARSGVHRAVLLEEAVDALAVRPDGTYVDATFGRGGHSRSILQRLGKGGRLIALDRDPAALEAARQIADSRFHAVHAGFADLAGILEEEGVRQGGVEGILLDLGVSSPQLDDAERGFSFRFDAPLDMRMDPTRGLSAAEWLATADEAGIATVLRDYGEERFAKQIAAAIVDARTRGTVATTRQLAEIVGQAVRTREPGQDPATRSFQAIRIFINEELAQLSLVLPQAVDCLAAGGRLVVISFHSLEDRIVKRFLREASQPPRLPALLPVREADRPRPRLELVGRAVRAGEAEIRGNPRARSAVMRVAERTAA